MKTKNNGTTAAQVKSMTKAFVAYMLGTESTWKPGDKVTFQFVFRNCNSAWEVTLIRESEDYAPFAYRLTGRQLTFEGHEPAPSNMGQTLLHNGEGISPHPEPLQRERQHPRPLQGRMAMAERRKQHG